MTEKNNCLFNARSAITHSRHKVVAHQGRGWVGGDRTRQAPAAQYAHGKKNTKQLAPLQMLATLIHTQQHPNTRSTRP
jgi:hypothetical protein